MERSSFYSEIEMDGQLIRCSYRVIEERKGTYGLLCSQEGMEKGELCRLRSVFRNEETAEAMAEFLAQKQVMPVHIRDVLQDLLA